MLCQRNKLSEGDPAVLLTPGSCGIPFTIRDLRNERGEKIDSAPHPYMTCTIEPPIEMSVGDLIRAGA